MSIQETIKSKKFKIAALIVGVSIVALVSFAGGVVVGFHKARFSYQWGANYERNFAGPRTGTNGSRGPQGMMPGYSGQGFRNAHGIAGQIISIAGNNIVIQDRNNQENTVTVSDKTIIKDHQNNITINDLKSGEQIVVMGSPGDSGTINADLIRVFSNANMNSDNAGNVNTNNPANNSDNNTNNNGQ